MHYVCLPRSGADPSKTHIGLTSDLKARIAKHNEGGTPHTAKFRPRNLVTCLAFSTREQATEFEGFL